VTFVDADAYDRFMGRYSGPLAPQLADLADVQAGQRALDVGCGPGALTAEFVARLSARSCSRRWDCRTSRTRHSLPFTLGVGPVGVYVRGLDAAGVAELRERGRLLLGDRPFTVTPRAWAARGRA
jgi:SAM-dependent methyltransferase